MTLRNWLILLLAFVFPSLVYAAIVTRGSFDLFAPVYGWQSYNHYALAIAEGRQDIPAEAISGEGLYVGGKVYMYYGMLPAFLRVPLIPFIDLRLVPVANLLVWSMVVAGQCALQGAALRVFRAHGRSGRLDWLLLALASFGLWFASGNFLVVQNANLYHQPYAAAALLASIFVAMLAQDLLVAKSPPSPRRLIAYAVVAGLAVFTRQTYAVGLYLATLALLTPPLHELRRQPGATIAATLRRGFVPIVVLGAFGIIYLAIAWARMGHLSLGWSVADWGFSIIEGMNARLQTLSAQQFSLVRILPNLVYILVGGSDLRDQWLTAWGSGMTQAYGQPLRYLLFTPLLLLLSVAGGVMLVRRAIPGALLVTLGLAVIAILQLSYATMNWRYTAELWPLLTWLVLVALRFWDPASLGRAAGPVGAAMLAMTLVSTVWIAKRPEIAFRDSPDTIGSLVRPLPDVLAMRATAPGSRDPDIEAVRARVGDGGYTGG